MQKRSSLKKTSSASSSGSNRAHVTAAIGLGKSRLQARRDSLFTQTVMWITGLACMALLLGTLTQAWSNSQLMQKVQEAQQQLQQTRAHHDKLTSQVKQFQDPAVIESEARQQLGYIRPGDHPVIIVDTSHQQVGMPLAQQNYWQKWWHALFG